MLDKTERQNEATKLAIGQETTYRGYPIFHEGSREFRIGVYANGLKDAKKVIDWMIAQGCLEKDE